MKKSLLIHTFKEEYLDLPLKDYTLTFDGGLYSQFYFWSKISKINTKKIFFISPQMICDGIQSKSFPEFESIMEGFTGNGVSEHFMTLDQVKFLSRQSKTKIGTYGYAEEIEGIALIDQINAFRQDLEEKMLWFKKKMKMTPKDYCFPNDQNLCFSILLRKYGITEIYNGERIPIESL